MRIVFFSLLGIACFSAYGQRVSPGQAKRRMDAKYGFRTARFEMDSTSLTPRVFVFDVGPVRFYARPTDTLQIGSGRLTSISYGFVRGQLSEIILKTSSFVNTTPVREAFQAQYGEGCTVCGPTYIWGSDKERIQIDVLPISGDGTFLLYSKEMAKVELSERHKAGKKAAGDL